MEEKHRIIIVDDHALVRAGLRRLLAEDPGIEVVGEAGSGRLPFVLTISAQQVIKSYDFSYIYTEPLDIPMTLGYLWIT